VADEDPQASHGAAQMRAAVIAVALSGLCLALGALAFFGGRTALGVAIGGGIATVNLLVFARLGDAFLGRKGKTAPWTVIAMLKLVVLFGGIWMILSSGVVSGLSLAAGYGALPLGITLGSLFGPKPPDDTEEPPER
jgi:hypothetical protein